MSSKKYEIEKFSRVNDFSLWSLKVKTILVQKSVLEELKGSEKMDVILIEKDNMMMIKKAHSAIILSLSDKKEGHTRNVCPKCLKGHDGKDNGNATVVQDNFESSDVLVFSSINSCKEWIMDLGCT
ncbi:unnamed protein product [Lathyrus oleraceus]